MQSPETAIYKTDAIYAHIITATYVHHTWATNFKIGTFWILFVAIPESLPPHETVSVNGTGSAYGKTIHIIGIDYRRDIGLYNAFNMNRGVGVILDIPAALEHGSFCKMKARAWFEKESTCYEAAFRHKHGAAIPGGFIYGFLYGIGLYPGTVGSCAITGYIEVL